MADIKITELTSKVVPAITDVFPMVENPASSPMTKKMAFTEILSLVYPVGSIYTSVTSTNPNTLFGIGTWTAFGAGRVLVGIDGGQTEFDTIEETGGAKTHTLTSGEMPSHTHTQNAHNHVLTELRDATTGSSVTSITLAIDATSTTGTRVTGSTTATNQNTGGGAAHNNLQPYIVVYFFKRTA